MPEAPPGDVIERHFDHDGWAHRKPFARLTFSPPARAARSVAGKAGRFDDRLAKATPACARCLASMLPTNPTWFSTPSSYSPSSSDAIDPSAESAKAADHAVGGVATLHFHHRVAAAEIVRDVAFGDDAVEARDVAGEPAARDFHVGR